MRPHFVWESAAQSVPHRPGKKYLLYFRGCCSPPTRGHLEAVRHVLSMFDPSDVHIVIDQLATEARHGVPKKLAVAMWRAYIEHCLPARRTYLFDGGFWSGRGRLENSADVVVFIRGDEGRPHHEVRHRFLHKNRSVLHRLRRKQVYYFAGKRTAGLSATQFVRSLADPELARTFMPPELPRKLADHFLQRLRALVPAAPAAVVP